MIRQLRGYALVFVLARAVLGLAAYGQLRSDLIE